MSSFLNTLSKKTLFYLGALKKQVWKNKGNET